MIRKIYAVVFMLSIFAVAALAQDHQLRSLTNGQKYKIGFVGAKGTDLYNPMRTSDTLP